MTARDYIAVLRRRWAYVVGALALCVGAAIAANMLLPREYVANLTIYISSASGTTTDNANAYQGSLLAQERMQSYRQLVSDTRVTSNVVNRLQLEETPGELASKIVVTNEPETVILDIGVTDESAERAARIANAVADSFVDLVAELEQPTDSSVPPALSARVVDDADPPLQPSAPRPGLNLALGVMVGLLLGVALAFLRDALGGAVKSQKALQKIVGAPNLATLSTEATKRQSPVISLSATDSSRWQEFQKLRNNLSFVALGTPRRAIVLTSALPEAGTTMSACNLAIALSSTGASVALVDADLRTPGVATMLGLERGAGLTTVITGGMRLDEAIQRYDGLFDVLTSGILPPNPAEVLGSEPMAELVQELRSRYDVILFDTPALHSVPDAAVLAAATDGALLLCRYGRTSQAQAAAAAATLRSASARVLGTIMTFVPLRRRQESHENPEPVAAAPVAAAGRATGR